MKADEMRLGPLLSGPKQFVVPYFQRAYSWRRHQWNTLFDDILELYELGSSSSHFLGSMVLLKDPAGPADGDESPTLVIDGQQRIVTLSLFLAAIRDSAGDTDPGFAGHLHYEYLADRAEDDLAVERVDLALDFELAKWKRNRDDPFPPASADRRGCLHVAGIGELFGADEGGEPLEDNPPVDQARRPGRQRGCPARSW